MAGKEARKHLRRPVQGMTIGCYRTEESARYKPRRNAGVAIHDISQGGCCLGLSELLVKGSPVTVEIKDLSSGDLFHARGEICWMQEQKGPLGEICQVGVKFLEIFTPIGKRDRFLQGKVVFRATAAPAVREEAPPEKGRTSVQDPPWLPKRAARFEIDDYTVNVLKAGLLGTVGLRRNLALGITDLSRTGAQVMMTEKLTLGARVLFMLHLNKFSDTFETEAEVVWVKEAPDGQAFGTGLKFENLTAARLKLLDYMMSWFTSYQHKYRQENRGGPPVGR